MKINNYFAIIRNLRNIINNSVSEYHLNLLYEAIINETAIQHSGILPFQFYSAYNSIKDIKNVSPKLLDAIESAMKISLGNIPRFNGKTISLCDNSGSAHGTFTSTYGSVTVSSIANLSGIITGMNSDEGYLGVFGDRLDIQPIRKSSSIFDCLNKANKTGESIGQGTENGIWIFLRDAIKNKTHYDNIFIYSDMQAGHGGLYGINPSEYSEYRWGSNISHYAKHIDVASLVNKYRSEVNKNVNVFLVQVAGYQDTIIPEFYDRTIILGGWSSELLKFASYTINMLDKKNN